ncbi:trypsin-like peptidase domain-containing protein [Streptomyces sp. ISL-99]|uniref:trypsin-like peptidase domain-containing protein n=1 Tax=Streptomyces sp. ISL-99 TaxID=2819193 RepID=UPI001BEC1ECB|nr:trypsin-like peptidase domain-containing protein [Streptomyces sp. ISL-99]MBT2524727.1 trypsin-like peptidase domain-containing protein [Streptomyces sp. ISL-99]
MAYIEVESPNGDLGIGSAFHVGEGVFVTARHVVENKHIREVCMTESVYIPFTEEELRTEVPHTFLNGDTPVHSVSNNVLALMRGPLFLPRTEVDVAIFKVQEINPRTPVIPLGSHLNDFLGQSDFVLSEAVVLGYPPIPMSTTPVLVGARAEVNAQVDLYDSCDVHFVLSATARGGFSGGLAFSEWGFALGLVTRSLLTNDGTAESGYMSVLSIEPIYECLAHHKLLPECQADGWDDLWNTQTLHFTRGEPGISGGFPVLASVDSFDDGRRYHLTVCCDDDFEVFEQALRTATAALSEYQTELVEIRPRMTRIHITGADPGSSVNVAITAALKATTRLFAQHGYISLSHPSVETEEPQV